MKRASLFVGITTSHLHQKLQDNQPVPQKNGEPVRSALVEDYLRRRLQAFGARCKQQHGTTSAQAGARETLLKKLLKRTVLVPSVRKRCPHICMKLFGLNLPIGEHLLSSDRSGVSFGSDCMHGMSVFISVNLDISFDNFLVVQVHCTKLPRHLCDFGTLHNDPHIGIAVTTELINCDILVFKRIDIRIRCCLVDSPSRSILYNGRRGFGHARSRRLMAHIGRI